MRLISKPLPRLAASFAVAPPRFITFARALAQASVIRIATYCRFVRGIIGSVALALLFMLALGVLSATTALNGIWKASSKRLSMARQARANRVDSNQRVIVRDLRKAGYAVRVTSTLGDGFPDLIVGAHGRNFLFEIKDPDKPPSERQLTDDQRLFFDDWRGQCDVIHAVEDAFEYIKLQIRLKP